MAKTFHLEIIATDRIFFSGEVEHLVITAIDGLIGILAGHEPLVTSLPTGELKYLVDGEWKYSGCSQPRYEPSENITEAFQVRTNALRIRGAFLHWFGIALLPAGG